MQHKRTWRTAALAAPLVLLVACAGAPIELGNVWKDPNYTSNGFSNILVIGVAASADNAAIFENVLSHELKSVGVQALAGVQVLPSTEMLDEDAIRTAVKDRGFDAVLVTRVLKVEEKKEVVPGTVYAMPGSYYRNYWGYYQSSYTMVHEPGYTIDTTTVTLESSLYDAASGNIVWTAQSRTSTPEDVVANIESLSHQVTRDLDLRGLLNKKAKTQ